jgi:hypothetical protein
MMRSWIVGCVVLVALANAGCGGSDGSSATLENRDTEGAYGFNGANWVLTKNDVNEDVWEKVGTSTKLVVDVSAGMTMTALDWAQSELANFQIAVPDVVIDFDATALDGSRAAWYGWDFVQEGSNVYEAYYVHGTTGASAELSGPGVTMSDAAAVLRSFQILKDL